MVMSLGKKESSVLQKLFPIATQKAPVARCRLIAAIVKRNKIFAIGNNSYCSSKLSRKFSKHELAPYVHAEIDAILKFLKKYPTRDISKYSLYVFRVKYDDYGNWTLGESKPCPGCQKAISYFGIRDVVYNA